MRNIIIIAVAVAVLSAPTAFAATTKAFTVVKMFAKVEGKTMTEIYRVEDKEYGNVCYLAYGNQNTLPNMSCVHND